MSIRCQTKSGRYFITHHCFDFHQTERNISSHKIPSYPLYPNICGQTEIPVVALDNENL